MRRGVTAPRTEIQWTKRYVCHLPLFLSDIEPIYLQQTVMNLGSCSKAFLSASLGILIQDFADGKNKSALPNTVAEFDWDTKIRDLLPNEWLTEDQWTTEKASFKDLLSHQTGLPAYTLVSNSCLLVLIAL
jgi:hypothetical protein